MLGLAAGHRCEFDEIEHRLNRGRNVLDAAPAQPERNVLEDVQVRKQGIGLEDDRQVKVYRFQINTTVQEVDGSRTPLRFISVAARDLDPSQKQEQGYLLLRYEIQAGQRLKIFPINSSAIAKAIEEKSLAGVVRRTKPPADGKVLTTKYQEIRVTAGPEQLRAFLKKTGSSCFEKEQVLEFQKIVTD